MTATSDLMRWWLWPLDAARLGEDLIETMTGARDVVAARSATIETALRDPLSADQREIGLPFDWWQLAELNLAASAAALTAPAAAAPADPSHGRRQPAASRQPQMNRPLRRFRLLRPTICVSCDGYGATRLTHRPRA